MITRLSVRTRLLIVVAVPLIALGGLTAVFLNGQFAQRSEATNDRALTSAFAQNGQAIAALRAEQVLSAGYMLTGDTAVSDQMSGVRAETDAAFAKAATALNTVQVDDPTGNVARLVTRYSEMVSGLPELRSQVDATDAGDVQDRLDDYDGRADIASEMNVTLVGATSKATDLSTDLVLDQTMTATGRQLAYATVLTEPGEVNDVIEGRFDAAGDRADALYLTYRTTLANAAERATVDAARRDEDAREAGSNMQALGSGVSAEDLGTSPAEFAPAAVDTIGVYNQAKTDILQPRLLASTERVEEANRQVWVAGAIAAFALLFTALIASVVVRSVIRPLRKLSDAAEELATNTLPRLVDSLVNPAVEAPAVIDLGMDGSDEICQLASAFDDVQRSIIDVSSRQNEVVTRGISDMYINLARRNQSLLDRQIQYIDSLESTEQDPDQLERLFRLDHLATRMRRNAESLLVLAGAEQGKRRTKAVPLSDVVRVAIGEVEDYQRLDILEIGEVSLRGDAAVDLAHLLSELMENGTQYSPPETTVDVVGHAAPDGAYAVVLTDRGMGMNEEQLAEANERLAVAPALGLGSGRSLGFVVVAALAARHQVSVRLSHGSNGGVVAAVTLPQQLVNPTAAAPASSMYAATPAPAQPAQAAAMSAPPSSHLPAPTITDAPTPSSWAPPTVETPETIGVPAESQPAAFGAPLSGEHEFAQPGYVEEPANDHGARPVGPLPTRGAAPAAASQVDAPVGADHSAPDHPAPTHPAGEQGDPIGWGTAFPGQGQPPLDPYADRGTPAPPTEVPPTAAPPTEVPPTAMPPTAMPPTEVPPTAMPPTAMPPTAMPPGPAPSAPMPPPLFSDQAPPESDPRSLGDAVPLGDAFEMGLYSLLDDESPESGQPPVPGGSPMPDERSADGGSPSGSSSLPTRAQGETLGEETHDPDAVVAGASSRSPDQVRSLLSNYRSARDQGRRDAAEEAPAPPSADPAAADGFDPLGGWDYASAEDSKYSEVPHNDDGVR